MTPQGRIEVIELLRGAAALSVALFHFTHVGELFDGSFIKEAGAYGWLGVEVFFVISGFIIPYSLWRGGYTLKRHGLTFLTKRIIRLDPPYFVAIVLVIATEYVKAAILGFEEHAPEFSGIQLLLHLGYLNAFFEYPWLSPVFWTLAIEFQYYVLVALIYPLLSHTNAAFRTALLILLCVLPVVLPAEAIVFHWLCLFVFGIVTFQYYAGLINRGTYFVLLGGTAIASWFSLGPLITPVGLATALVIAFIKIKKVRAFTFLGAISYSLYLVHVPLGSRVMYVGTLLDPVYAYAFLVLAFAVSIAAAWILYRLVEGPARRWSSRITYNKPPSTQADDTTPEDSSLIHR